MKLDTKEPEIVFTINERGAFEVEVHNVAGPLCKALTKPYEDMFPGATEVRKTDEYHQTVRVSERKQQKL